MGKRCDFHNEWTWRDGFHTLRDDGSPADIHTLVEADQAGASINQLAGEFGVHRTTEDVHLDRHGVPRHSEQTARDDDLLKEAVDLNSAGLSLANVADQFGVDAQTVANRFRRAGMPMRPRRGSNTRVCPGQDRR